MIRLRWGAATDTGRVRTVNEDSVLAVEHVFAVADGMGGHAAGEVASSVALDTVKVQFDPGTSSVTTVTEAIRAANQAVFRRALDEPTARGMGTTLTLIAPATGADGQDHLVVANVGDSRGYLFADGELRQLTRDHSYVEEMLAAGQITPAEARTHPHRHVVTRALGVEQSVAVDTWLVTPEPGDRYLLCSDGLVNEVSDAGISEILGDTPDPQGAASALVAAANAAGGRDNISVIVIDVVSASGRTPDGTQPTTRVQEQVGGWLPDDPTQSFDRTDAGPTVAGGSALTPSPSAPKVKRRLVTGRTVVFTTLVLAVFVVAIAAAAAFGRSGYYVGFEGDAVAVYQGRPGGVLWFQPTLESVSDITRADLPADVQARLERSPSFSSQAAADRFIAGLAESRDGLVVEVTTTSSPGSTGPTTTGVGAPASAP